jgi:hypothetical protein
MELNDKSLMSNENKTTQYISYHWNEFSLQILNTSKICSNNAS